MFFRHVVGVTGTVDRILAQQCGLETDFLDYPTGFDLKRIIFGFLF
jgi:hypothetical protein